MSSLWQLRARRFWSLVAASSFFALVLSIGPQAQTYLFSLLNSQVPTVYGAVYQQALIQFPSLASWVGEALKWQVVAMGMFVAWFTTKNPEPRVLFWNTAWSSAAIQSCLDIVGALLWYELTIRWAVENLVANIIGGAVVAALAVATFAAADFAYKHAPIGPVVRGALSPLVLVLAGLLYCCGAYYVAGIFFEPLPARFDISMSAPSSGATALKSGPSDVALKDHDRQFSFSPDDSINANVHWISPHGNTVVRTGTVGEELPSVELRAFGGCVNATEAQKVAAGTQAWLSTSNVSHFEIASDNGPTDFETAMPSQIKSKIKIDAGQVTMFSIDEEPSSKSLKVTQFVDKGASVDMHSSRTAQFFLGLPLMSGDEKKMALKPRMLTLRIGPRTHFVRFWPPKSVRAIPERTECRVLTDLNPPDREDQTDIDPKDFLVGVLVTITRPADEKSMSVEDLPIRITSSGGWMTLAGLQAADLRAASLGRLSMLQARGNISDLLLDEVAQTSRQIETYTAVGDLQAQFVQGKFRVFGQARRLWKDQSRLNATKWEKLGWEQKSALLAMVVSTIGVLGAAIARRLRSNQQYGWML